MTKNSNPKSVKKANPKDQESRRTKVPGRRVLPGDPQDLVASMVRVDHAGEFGAVAICEGQAQALRFGAGLSRYLSKNAARVTKRHVENLDVIERMTTSEREHLAEFEQFLAKRQEHPTYFLPLWALGAGALGFFPALFGMRAAMAVTEGVERVIEAHYSAQVAALPKSEQELKDCFQRFGDDEMKHREEAARFTVHNPRRSLPTRFLKGLSYLSEGITRLAIGFSARA